jgi:hypothetical protein
LIGTQWHNVQTGSVEHPTNPQQVQLGSIDQVMQSHGATPLAVALKRAQPHAKVLAVGGAGCATANAAASWLGDYVLCPVRRGRQWIAGSVTGHALPPSMAAQIGLRAPVRPAGRRGVAWKVGEEDDFIARYAVASLRKTRAALVIVSFDELAARKPLLGPSGPNTVRVLLRGVDRDIGRVVTELRREGVANRTTFVVTAGSSMPIPASTASATDLARSITAAGGQQAYIGGGEAATIGLQDVLQAQPVAQALQDLHLRGLDAVYYKTQTQTGWKYQPQYLDPDLPASFSTAASFLLGTVVSPTAPDVVAAFAPGYAVRHRGDNGSAGPGIGWDSQHIPLIIAGHGVQGGARSDYPARLVDIAPTIAAAMGLGSVPSDGIVLADALQQPPDGSEDAERARASRLDFYVSSLENREQAARR